MQYVWQHRLWPMAEMRTVDGRVVQVIDPGKLNNDAGPDFFNAKVSIDGHLWAGNVEIHVKASDWRRHKHDTDTAYDSVILHVVDKDDAIVRRSNGEIIPQMRMPCAPDLNIRYSDLVGRADRDLPCASSIKAINPIYISDWLSALAYERLYEKSDRLMLWLDKFAGDWEQTCYVAVARGLGFGINGDPFQRLAMSLPLRFIGKHSDSLTSIEALLFGQSGLLDEARNDEYAARLRKEYDFLAHKFGLKKPESLGWKMARMRPANFPHRRIAILASMLHNGFRMTKRIVDVSDIDEAVALFGTPLSGYWETRYSFGPAGKRIMSALSRSSASVMVINVVVPLMYSYGIKHGNDAICDKAITLLQSLPAERNSIIDLFEQADIKVRDAFHSQAIVQLRRNYCEKRKCMYCRIGHRMLASYACRRD